MADDVARWDRGRVILGLQVEDMERTRALKLDLELLQGVRRDDPARALIAEHARSVSDDLAAMRTLRHELREACAREIEDMDGMIGRATQHGVA